MKRQNGFSLIELLIVVAIILVIAAIAVPNWVRARISANEASAISSVRTISTAQTIYNTSYPAVGFTTLSALGGAAPCTATAATACILDANLSAGSKSGYLFVTNPNLSAVPSPGYTTNADPGTVVSGTRHFFSNEPGVITYNTTAPATAADPPIN